MTGRRSDQRYEMTKHVISFSDNLVHPMRVSLLLIVIRYPNLDSFVGVED